MFATLPPRRARSSSLVSEISQKTDLYGLLTPGFLSPGKTAPKSAAARHELVQPFWNLPNLGATRLPRQMRGGTRVRGRNGLGND